MTRTPVPSGLYCTPIRLDSTTHTSLISGYSRSQQCNAHQFIQSDILYFLCSDAHTSLFSGTPSVMRTPPHAPQSVFHSTVVRTPASFHLPSVSSPAMQRTPVSLYFNRQCNAHQFILSYSPPRGFSSSCSHSSEYLLADLLRPVGLGYSRSSASEYSMGVSSATALLTGVRR